MFCARTALQYNPALTFSPEVRLRVHEIAVFSPKIGSSWNFSMSIQKILWSVGYDSYVMSVVVLFPTKVSFLGRLCTSTFLLSIENVCIKKLDV